VGRLTVEESDERRRGYFALAGAFGIWGLLPLYLKPLHAVPPVQIMSHRLVWCSVFVAAWLGVRGELGAVRRALVEPHTRKRLAATAVFISTNWLVYVSAVATGHVVEASLGYFINPLVNVLLGVLVLRERLDRVQWTAVGIAGAGVAYLTWIAGRPPWIALVLAVSFGAYGLLRKTVAVEALVGLGAETLLIAPIGAAYLLFVGFRGTGAALHDGPFVDALLLGGGPLTALPLALFSFGARRVAYSTVGLFQYIGPTLQLLLGIFLYGEPFTHGRALGFAAIWAALALYAGNGIVAARRAPRIALEARLK
jgi:chloramphenicol-sensitive protein RarD